MKNRVKSVLALAALTALANGCGGTRDLVAQGKLSVEARGTPDAVAARPYVYEDNGKLLVNGVIESPKRVVLKSTGHVDVELLDAAGETLDSTTVPLSVWYWKLRLDKLPPYAGKYKATFPTTAPDGGMVRIIAGCTQNHK